MTENEPARTRVKNIEIGRVLRANTAGFTIGSRVNQLTAPCFGGLVKAQPVEERETIYGLIYDMHIDDDPLVRRLVLAEEPSPAVIEDQRNNRLLPLEMSVLSVGYALENQLRHTLPPRPPLNLDPVFLCQDLDEVRQFTEQLGYLRLVLRADNHQIPVDQLLVAHIVNSYEQRGHDLKWVKRTIEELTGLMRYDYELLIPVLEMIGQRLPELG